MSRIPGMESLGSEVSCSTLFTLGISHMCDVDYSKNSSFANNSLNAIISVFDDSTLLKNV